MPLDYDKAFLAIGYNNSAIPASPILFIFKFKYFKFVFFNKALASSLAQE
jgi:hypothetical protein